MFYLDKNKILSTNELCKFCNQPLRNQSDFSQYQLHKCQQYNLLFYYTITTIDIVEYQPTDDSWISNASQYDIDQFLININHDSFIIKTRYEYRWCTSNENLQFVKHNFLYQKKYTYLSEYVNYNFFDILNRSNTIQDFIDENNLFQLFS